MEACFFNNYLLFLGDSDSWERDQGTGGWEVRLGGLLKIPTCEYEHEDASAKPHIRTCDKIHDTKTHGMSFYLFTESIIFYNSTRAHQLSLLWERRVSHFSHRGGCTCWVHLQQCVIERRGIGRPDHERSQGQWCGLWHNTCDGSEGVNDAVCCEYMSRDRVGKAVWFLDDASVHTKKDLDDLWACHWGCN